MSPMPGSRRELWLLLTLAAVQFTHIMDFMIMMPLGPQLMRLFEISPAQFSLIVSAYTFSAGSTSFLSAFWIDRFDRRQALRFLYVGFLGGTLLVAFAGSYHLLVAARIVTGAFGGGLSALVFSIVGDTIPAHRRGRAMGVVMTAFAAASVFGVPFGLVLASWGSWHYPFLFLAAIGLVVQYLIGRFVPEIRGHLSAGIIKVRPLVFLREIAANKNELTALSLVPMLMIGHFSVIPFLSPYMVSNVGFSEMQLPYIYIAGGLATIVTSPIAGRLSDRIGPRPVFAVAAALALIPIWLVTHMGRSPIAWVLVVTTILFITANGRMVPVMTMVTSTVEPRRRGGFMAINSSLQQMFAGIAAFIAGSIVVRAPDGRLLHFDSIFYLTIVATFLCILIASKIRPIVEAPPADEPMVADPV